MALLVAGCPKKSATSDAGQPSGSVPDAAPSAAKVEQLPPPTALAMDPTLDAGAATQMMYAQKSQGIVSMGSVDAKAHRAILRIDAGDKTPQLVTVDLVNKTIVNTWSPTPILQKVIRMSNMAGPALADSLSQAPAFRADLTGWASRVAAGGDPWTDGFISTCPGTKRITFTAGFSTWLVGPDGGSPRDIGAVGHPSLSPSCRLAAWSGIDAAHTEIPARLFIADLDATTPGAPATELVNVEAVTWSPDESMIYFLAKGTCLHAFDVKTKTAKQIVCQPGHMSNGFMLSADGHTGAISSFTADPNKLYTDLVFVTLPAGVVKRKVRIPVNVHISLIDDAGLYVAYGYNHGQFLVRVDLAAGTQRVTDDDITERSRRRIIESLAWYGPRSVLALRQTATGAALEEIDLDRLAQVAPDKMPQAVKR